MKIVTHKGQPYDGPWKRQMHCKKGDCDTVFEVTTEDIEKGCFGGSYCESGEDKLYVECPMCGNSLIMNNLPSAVSGKVYAKYNAYNDRGPK
jgi:hypothetical protein